MSQRDLELLPFRRVLDAGIERARVTLKKVFLPIALPVVAVTLAMSLFQVRLMKGFPSFDSSTSGLEIFEVFYSSVVMVGLMVLMMAVYGLAYLAMSVAAMDALAGRPVDVAAAWKRAVQPGMIWTLFLVLVFSFLSVLACFLPALVVIPMLSFALPVAIEEKRTGMDAISRSLELARFNPRQRWAESPWMQALVVTIIGWVVQQAMSLVAQAPFLVAQQILIAREVIQGGGDVMTMSSGVLWLQVPMSLFGAIAGVAGWIFWTFTIGLLFREVRRRREGADLEAAIVALGNAPA